MELQSPTPPAYVAHNPADLSLPSVPRTDISRPHVYAEITLPNLRTVLSSDYHDGINRPDSQSSHTIQGSPSSARSLPPIDLGHTYSNGSRTSIERAIASPSEAGSVMSIEDRGARSTSVSMDDPDVRIAAEALSGLGNPDFVRSPTGSRSHASPITSRAIHEEPEPLLELFTKAHPWVAGTINGSLNAYTTTIHHSPRLVQYGANLVERSITTPVVSTVSTVGRMTGVESGLRWYYGGSTRRPNDESQDEVDSSSKRRRLMNNDLDLEIGHVDRRDAIHRDSIDSRPESLPRYPGSKPPSYREEVSPDRRLDRSTHNRSWSSQVFVMTSGLGVALNSTSRHSLRFCLGLLGQSAERVSTLMDALKMVLEQYDQARDAWHQNHDDSIEKGERPKTPEHDEAARRLAELLKKHSDEIWQTLRTVVNSVSNYAGGALPENARQFVRNQLMSLPQRWRLVSDNQIGDSETSRSGHRMIAFATEGLDMMSQVSQTMKLTLDSAERWLERTGSRRELIDSPRTVNKDHAMAEADHTPFHDEKR